MLVTPSGIPTISHALSVFQVDIQGIDDHVPVFKRPIHNDCRVKEDIGVGSPVCQIAAVDHDKGDESQITVRNSLHSITAKQRHCVHTRDLLQLQYSLDDLNNTEERGPFDINLETGEITTTDRLDFEMRWNYELSVKASSEFFICLCLQGQGLSLDMRHDKCNTVKVVWIYVFTGSSKT